MHDPLIVHGLSFSLIQKSKPQEAGKDKARTLIVGFRESCKRKIENRQLGPREFEASKMPVVFLLPKILILVPLDPNIY